MPTPTRRRWYQFSISTWFVLVAILAWAIKCDPWVVTLFDEPRLGYWDLTRILYPALALVAFVGWKVTRLIIERRSAKRVVPQS